MLMTTIQIYDDDDDAVLMIMMKKKLSGSSGSCQCAERSVARLHLLSVEVVQCKYWQQRQHCTANACASLRLLRL